MIYQVDQYKSRFPGEEEGCSYLWKGKGKSCLWSARPWAKHSAPSVSFIHHNPAIQYYFYYFAKEETMVLSLRDKNIWTISNFLNNIFHSFGIWGLDSNVSL